MKKITINKPHLIFFIGLLLLILQFDKNEARLWHERKAEGWAWYEDREENKQEEEKPTENMTYESATEELESQRKDLMEKLAKATLDPTEENVEDYIKNQKILVERSEKFAKSWAKVLLQNPELDVTAKENSTSFYGAQVQKQLKEQKKELLISKLVQEQGLFYFYRGNDKESQAFAFVVKLLEKKYGFEILGISVDGYIINDFKNNQIDNGIVDKLGVKIFPALFMVNPDNQEFVPISYGMRALDQVEDNIFLQFGDEEND